VRSVNDSACTESYTADIDWTMLHDNCGLSSEASSNWIYYNGTLNVEQIDVLPSIRGESVNRTMNSPFAFEISFPTNVQVQSSETTVYAPIEVDAAVVSQTYTLSSKAGLIQLYTSVQYPFLLVPTSMTTTTSGANVAISLGQTVSCPASGPGPCNVIYNINITSSSALCSLDGTYTANFTLQCESGIVGDCPLQGNWVAISFEVTSSSLCGAFGNQVDISAVMLSYLDSGNTVQRNAFLEDQRMFFRVTTSSNAVSLFKTYVLNCSSIFDASSSLLYSGGSVGAPGTTTTVGGNADFSVGAATATSAAFSLTATAELFPVDPDQSANCVVECFLGVEYQDALSKRSVVDIVKRSASGVQDSVASAQFTVAGQSNYYSSTEASDATAVRASQFAVFLALLVSFLLLL